MPPRMTSTATKRGFIIALICGSIFLSAWLLLGGAIAVATGRIALDLLGGAVRPDSARERCPTTTEL